MESKNSLTHGEIFFNHIRSFCQKLDLELLYSKDKSSELTKSDIDVKSKCLKHLEKVMNHLQVYVFVL